MPSTNENSAAEREIAVGEGAQIDDRLPGRQHAREEDDGGERPTPRPAAARCRRRTSRCAGPPPARIRARRESPPSTAGPTSRSCSNSDQSGLSKSISDQRGDGDDDAGHDVDEEQPVPGQRVGQIAADRRADGRRQRRDQADQRRDQAHARAREDQVGGGEHGRDHAAADEALHRRARRSSR